MPNDRVRVNETPLPISRRSFVAGLPLAVTGSAVSAGQGSPILELFWQWKTYRDWIAAHCDDDEGLDHHTGQLLELEAKICAPEAVTVEELAAQWLTVNCLGSFCGGLDGPDKQEVLLLQRMMGLVGVPVE